MAVRPSYVQCMVMYCIFFFSFSTPDIILISNVSYLQGIIK
uniref:Uncharacterized protein n=1 Tax=Anguilla anguilla TaxID=7936 RepID=A0A0E9PEB8_ANGAN